MKSVAHRGRRIWRSCAGATMLVALAGCDRGFFHATGTVASEGGALGTWTSTPQGCTRDAFDGAPQASTRSLLALLWEDPGERNPMRANFFDPREAPLRLEIERAQSGPGVVAVMHGRHHDVLLDQHVCRTLRLETQEIPKGIAEGRPALSGTLALDCSTQGSHVTARLAFERCEF